MASGKPDPVAAAAEREVDAMCRAVMRTAAASWEAECRPRAGAGAAPASEPAPGAPQSPQTPEAKRTLPARPEVPESAAACQDDPVSNPAAANGGTPGGAAARRPRVKWPAAMGRQFRFAPVDPGLQPRQIMAARLLLAGRRVSDVAAHLGVNRHTIANWLKDEQFQREVRRMAMELPLPDRLAGLTGPGAAFGGEESP